MSELAENAEGPVQPEDLHRDITEGLLNQHHKGELIDFLDDEQPHYIAELLDDDAWKGRSVHVVLSDQYIRVISSRINVAIRYATVTNAWLEGMTIRLTTVDGEGAGDAYQGSEVSIGYDSLRGARRESQRRD